MIILLPCSQHETFSWCDTAPSPAVVVPMSVTSPSPLQSPFSIRTRVLSGRITKAQVKPGSRKDRLLAARMHPQFQATPPRPAVAALPKAVNHDKWVLAVGGIMPPQSPPWEAAKARVNRHAKLNYSVPKESAGLMYPDPSYINGIQPANRGAAAAAWLSIRGARCGQMAYPDLYTMPVASSTTWRHFFALWRRKPSDFLAGDQSVDAAVAAARSMFGPEMVNMMKDTFTQVFWNGQPFDVIDGAVVHMSDSTYTQVAWELMELNWRYEVMALDRILAPAQWKDKESSDRRIE
ncbi:hypothetical protein HWV62_45274 [Athelia sp. TMB]|nr:hypothetical protein HWV62_45274 [Athelia sp. TMB]